MFIELDGYGVVNIDSLDFVQKAFYYGSPAIMFTFNNRRVDYSPYPNAEIRNKEYEKVMDAIKSKYTKRT